METDETRGLTHQLSLINEALVEPQRHNKVILIRSQDTRGPKMLEKYKIIKAHYDPECNFNFDVLPYVFMQEEGQTWSDAKSDLIGFDPMLIS